MSSFPWKVLSKVPFVVCLLFAFNPLVLTAVIAPGGLDSISIADILEGVKSEADSILKQFVSEPQPVTSDNCDNVCEIFGDPHMRTFDCVHYSYHGKCDYTLMKTCDEDLEYFEVIGDFHRLEYHKHMSVINSLQIKFKNRTMELDITFEVKMDGEQMANIPETSLAGWGSISRNKSGVFVRLDNGVNIQWKSPFKFVASVESSDLAGKVCGLCGNNNGRKSDDFKKPSGEQSYSVVDFADSWRKNPETCSSCDDCESNLCTSNPGNKQQATEICTPESGQACDGVDQEQVRSLCISTLCATLPEKKAVCPIVSQYMQCEGVTFSNLTSECHIDDCDPNPCGNRGTCTDGINSYTCNCDAGYSGLNCETDIDDCDPNPCRNVGTCTDGINSYTCNCDTGYTGPNCETGPCEPNPCNDGTCRINDDGSYDCVCNRGTSGSNCEQKCTEVSALGMEDGSISNAQITASSFYTGQGGLYAWKGRLNGNDYWATATGNPYDPWIQVDFSNTIIVEGITTQGSGHSHQEWVTALTIQTGESVNALTYIMEDNQPKVFPANTNKDIAVDILFPEPVTTRYLRIRPTEWQSWCSLRFEVIGCEMETGSIRSDLRCGPRYLAPNGMEGECDPNGKYPCCSTAGWCGITYTHCVSMLYKDYRVPIY